MRRILEFTEDDVYGKTRTAEFSAKNPAHLTPMLEIKELPKGGMWESCAIMQYLCNKHEINKFYPKNAEQRAMIDSAMFYLIGTLYPLVSRATYPALGFPQYPGEVGASDADATAKEAAKKAAIAAIAEPLDVFHKFYMDGKPYIGRRYAFYRRYKACGYARISFGCRLSASSLGKNLYGRHGELFGQGLF